MAILNFKELQVWQKAMVLAKTVYLLTRQLPKDEQFGLISQMRRSAVSIPSNIAEGKQRKTTKDFLQFLHIADGSCAELETQLLLVQSLFPSVDVDTAMMQLGEIQRMLGSLMSTISEH